MCEDCGWRLIKAFLVIVNLFFLLLGLLMLAFGIALVVNPAGMVTHLHDVGVDAGVLGANATQVIHGVGIFMIILGSIAALIGFLGFFGACCDNKCLLVTYLICVIVILLIEIALIIFAACFPTPLASYVQQGMNLTLITNFNQDATVYPNFTLGSTDDGVSWASTQFGVGCCGVYSPNDYYSDIPASARVVQYPNSPLPGYTDVTAVYPISCCSLTNGPGIPSTSGGSNIFVDLHGCLTNMSTQGFAKAVNQPNCYTGVEKLISQFSKIAIGIAAAIAGFLIILIILGFCLCCHWEQTRSQAI